MSDAPPDSDRRKALAKLPDNRPYAVGYGKPPHATRFKSGRSGNPKGRPRGRKGKAPTPPLERLKAIVLDEAYRTIKVNDGDRQVSVSMAQAIIRSMAVTAAKGNTRAQKLFAELLATTEASHKKQQDEWLEAALNYKIEWEMDFDRRRKLGQPLPELPLHPDDIVIDYRHDTVEIRGPMSKEEVKELEHFLCRQAEFEKELNEAIAMRDDPENATIRDLLERDIAHDRRVLEILAVIIAQRASPGAIKRLVASGQVVVDPEHRDPDTEARLELQRRKPR